MITTTTPHPDVPLPPGALEADDWQGQSHRVVFGAYRDITDSSTCVSTAAVQRRNGSIDDGSIEAPSVTVLGAGESNPFNSDQARELAAALLEAAAVLDGWVRS